MKDPKELIDPKLFDDPSFLMISSYSMIPSYLMINWKMDFDNPKVYGDTSITDGLVSNVHKDFKTPYVLSSSSCRFYLILMIKPLTYFLTKCRFLPLSWCAFVYNPSHSYRNYKYQSLTSQLLPILMDILPHCIRYLQMYESSF